MKIYKSIPDNKKLFKNPVVTIGNFDGVHIGHKQIFSTLLKVSREKSGDPVVITFSTHPRKILYPDDSIKILTTTDEKVNAIFNIGITNIILLNFTKKMASMTAEDFLHDILMNKLDAKHLVIGYDHHFGKNREGNFEFLKTHSSDTGISITKVQEKNIYDETVSSSWLRREIENGNIEKANSLLDRSYSLSGKVIQGDGRGRELGFPTANISLLNPDKLVPADGVYAVSIILDDNTRKQGMLNIGKNPTFSVNEQRIEVNIFNFNDNIYNSNITIEFHKKIRDEQKFSSKDKLIDQMKIDKQIVLQYIKTSHWI